jgi:hypothetical protein
LVTVFDDPRPAFAVRLTDDVVATIVKLGRWFDRRIIAAAHGRADERTRGDADWDLFGRELRQDVVRTTVEPMESGIRLRPAVALNSGEYAVVIRPLSKKKIAGASALSGDGDGRLLMLAWRFAIG